MNVKKLTLTSAEYPEPLRHISSPPKQLFVLGDLQSLLEAPRVAVVGSRKVTPYGRAVTEMLAGELAAKGIVIISGLALGVDAVAHRAALDAGGKTLAVLPTSLDNIYPSVHRDLARKIVASGGVLVSEYDTGMPGLKKNFIERNRLVSGLSDAVLITEAAQKSGTLHTANFALEQGRTVLTVPGNITSAGSEGTNNLIKSGALPVTETADIFEALHLTPKDLQRQLPLGTNAAEQAILDHMQAGISDATALMHAAGMDAAEFSRTLSMLEISGRVVPLGAGQWRIR